MQISQSEDISSFVGFLRLAQNVDSIELNYRMIGEY
jgi:hypothetical protein